jgi:hypothetical protein
VYVDALEMLNMDPDLSASRPFARFLKAAYARPEERQHIVPAIDQLFASRGDRFEHDLYEYGQELLEWGREADTPWDARIQNESIREGRHERRAERGSSGRDATRHSQWHPIAANIIVRGNQIARTLYYVGLCELYGVGYVPHPARSVILRGLFTGAEEDPLTGTEPIPSRLVGLAAAVVQEAFAELSPRTIGHFQYPPLAGTVLQTWQHSDNYSIVDAVLRVREHPAARAFREWSSWLNASGEDRPDQVLREYQKVQQAIERWKVDAREGVYHERRPLDVGFSKGLLGLATSYLVDAPVLARFSRRERVLFFLHTVAFRKPF